MKVHVRSILMRFSADDRTHAVDSDAAGILDIDSLSFRCWATMAMRVPLSALRAIRCSTHAGG